MTITEESTSRPADGTLPEPSTTPSLFQRICCCCYSDLKEPPVQLIRSGSLTYQQGAAVVETTTSQPNVPEGSISNNVISAATNSVDEKVSKAQTSQKQNEEDIESVNMNDLMMENVLREEDRTEAVEEDNVSISTNVVQEVDENELKKALKKKQGNDSNEQPKLKGRSGISKEMQSGSENSEDEGNGENRKMSVIEFIRSEAHAETSTTLPSPPLQQVPEVREQNEKLSEATQSEISDSEDDLNSEKNMNVMGMSSKTTARAERTPEEQQVREFKELSSDESLKGSNAEDEIIGAHDDEIDEDVPPPLPTSPPPRLSVFHGQQEGSPIPPPRSPQKTSLMYAHADDDSSEDEDSDDEASETDEHPVGSNGLVRMHPVNFAAHRNEDVQSISSESSISTASAVSEKENEEEESTTIGVTRISVKSDGRAEIHSPKSPVRVTLEPDRNEVTDDDFSEKLI